MEPTTPAPPADEAPTTVQETAPAAAPAPAAEPRPEPAPCSRCGAPLRPDQEWCLNCGAATGTRIASPSGWKVPVAIIASVLALALAGLVVAFLAVSDDGDELGRLAQTQTAPAPAPGGAPAPTPAPPPPAETPAPPPADAPADTVPAPPPADEGAPPADGGVASWPAGKDGYTVVLASPTSRAAAERRADDEIAAGREAGILDSDDFSSLRGGFFVVFSGVYDTENEAEAALEGLGGADGAYIRKVTPR